MIEDHAKLSYAWNTFIFPWYSKSCADSYIPCIVCKVGSLDGEISKMSLMTCALYIELF
jgi:hypothetical protein